LQKPSFYAMPKNCIRSFSLFQVIFFFVLMKIYFRELYISYLFYFIIFP
jgi:hypothetical protein